MPTIARRSPAAMRSIAAARGRAAIARGSPPTCFWLTQDPASPHPREGAALSPLVPLDANHNPAGAFLDETRVAAAVGHERPVGSTTTLTVLGSYTHSAQRQFRGFLTDVSDTPDNATGFRENIDVNDLYGDAHLTFAEHAHVRFVAGGDLLFGNGEGRGATFLYTAPLERRRRGECSRADDPRPRRGEPPDVRGRLRPRRDHAGASRAAVDGPSTERHGRAPRRRRDRQRTRVRAARWAPSSACGSAARITSTCTATIGTRSNRPPSTSRWRRTKACSSPKPRTASRAASRSARWTSGSMPKPRCSAWTSRTWSRRPSSTDFRRSSTRERRGSRVWSWPATRGCGPVVSARGTYSFHDATFVDFVQAFDGVPTQLAGKRLEMSARHLVSGGVILAPGSGIIGQRHRQAHRRPILEQAQHRARRAFHDRRCRGRLPLRGVRGARRRAQPQRPARSGVGERARRRAVLSPVCADVPRQFRPRF